MAEILDPQDPVATHTDELDLLDVPVAPPAPAFTPAASPPGTGAVAVLPPGVALASVGKKFGAYLLDGFVMFMTVGIGWLIWGAIVAGKGQTPGRQLLGLRVVSMRDGRPLTWGQMVFLHGLVGAFVTNVAFVFTLGVLAFMPLWDRNNQTVADKVASSVVVDDPRKVYG